MSSPEHLSRNFSEKRASRVLYFSIWLHIICKFACQIQWAAGALGATGCLG
jgi:hypothetical protein